MKPNSLFPMALAHILTACPSDQGLPGGAIGPGGTTDVSSSTGGSIPTTSTTGAPVMTSTTSTPMDSTTEAGSTSTGDEDMTSSSTGSSSDAAPLPSCGDGHVDPGEACDLGADNDPQGACTLACKLATCGDGLLWAGNEECDRGENNNDSAYGGCTTQCKNGDRCQDGKVQGPEECDLGAKNGTGESSPGKVPCDNGCRFQARLAFLSSVAYKGGELGGVEGAHLKCQALAKQAQWDNSSKFLAWISDAQHSPNQDFDHGPDKVGLPYVRPDGIRIADDWNDLSLNGLLEGIVVTDAGELLLEEYVWTGTAPSGKLFDPAATCKAWSSSKPSDQSRVGLSGVENQQVQAHMQWVSDRQWTSAKNFGCHNAYRIYCVEQ